jgi:hypothetical protein
MFFEETQRTSKDIEFNTEIATVFPQPSSAVETTRSPKNPKARIASHGLRR